MFSTAHLENSADAVGQQICQCRESISCFRLACWPRWIAGCPRGFLRAIHVDVSSLESLQQKSCAPSGSRLLRLSLTGQPVQKPIVSFSSRTDSYLMPAALESWKISQKFEHEQCWLTRLTRGKSHRRPGECRHCPHPPKKKAKWTVAVHKGAFCRSHFLTKLI
jgi:hypothetical protein